LWEQQVHDGESSDVNFAPILLNSPFSCHIIFPLNQTLDKKKKKKKKRKPHIIHSLFTSTWTKPKQHTHTQPCPQSGRFLSSSEASR
jgi:hypothetical protein